MDNTCVCCGKVIPEGTMICKSCSNETKETTNISILDLIKESKKTVQELIDNNWYSNETYKLLSVLDTLVITEKFVKGRMNNASNN